MTYPYLEVEDSRNVLSLQPIGCPHSRIPLRELWECQDEAKAIILDHKFLVLALAKELREKHSMSYEEIIACLKKAEKLNPSEDYIKEFLRKLL